jgi:valyl-tRNA synthetase
VTLKRDEDVLDTWFSSGLWPFRTLGWPDKTSDLENYFPTTTLETGWDIIPFWVSRIIMFSLKLTGKVPFTEVFCHGLILYVIAMVEKYQNRSAILLTRLTYSTVSASTVCIKSCYTET